MFLILNLLIKSYRKIKLRLNVFYHHYFIIIYKYLKKKKEFMTRDKVENLKNIIKRKNTLNNTLTFFNLLLI